MPSNQLRLPSAEQFADILGNIESSGAWCAYDAADLVRFLAYSGCRISEAANVKRDDVDQQAGTIRISGDPVLGTKNSESRTIPINPAMHDELQAAFDQFADDADQFIAVVTGAAIGPSAPAAI